MEPPIAGVCPIYLLQKTTRDVNGRPPAMEDGFQRPWPAGAKSPCFAGFAALGSTASRPPSSVVSTSSDNSTAWSSSRVASGFGTDAMALRHALLISSCAFTKGRGNVGAGSGAARPHLGSGPYLQFRTRGAEFHQRRARVKSADHLAELANIANLQLRTPTVGKYHPQHHGGRPSGRVTDSDSRKSQRLARPSLRCHLAATDTPAASALGQNRSALS